MSGKSILGKSLFLIAVAASAALLIVFTALQKDAVPEDPVLPVEIITPAQGELKKTISVSGFIESETMVTLLPRIGGTLEDIYLEMGDPVEKDQIVGLIDSESYTLTYNQARAAYLAAESTFRRISSLYATKSVSQQNYDEAKANFDALQASYELAELNLSYTELKSPVSGVVLEKHVSKGAMVAPQIPVVTIGDLSDLRVKCGIPEIHYSHFSENKDSMEISVRVPALENRIFQGNITNIAPYISSASRNFSILCRIHDEQEVLRPGMFVYVDFTMEKKENIYSLPYGVLAGEGFWYVDSDKAARFVLFEPQYGNEESFELPAEYAHLKIVRKGQHFLEEGRKVRISGE